MIKNFDKYVRETKGKVAKSSIWIIYGHWKEETPPTLERNRIAECHLRALYSAVILDKVLAARVLSTRCVALTHSRVDTASNTNYYDIKGVSDLSAKYTHSISYQRNAFRGNMVSFFLDILFFCVLRVGTDSNITEIPQCVSLTYQKLQGFVSALRYYQYLYHTVFLVLIHSYAIIKAEVICIFMLKNKSYLLQVFRVRQRQSVY